MVWFIIISFCFSRAFHIISFVGIARMHNNGTEKGTRFISVACIGLRPGGFSSNYLRRNLFTAIPPARSKVSHLVMSEGFPWFNSWGVEEASCYVSSFPGFSFCIINPMLSMNFKQRVLRFDAWERVWCWGGLRHPRKLRAQHTPAFWEERSNLRLVFDAILNFVLKNKFKKIIISLFEVCEMCTHSTALHVYLSCTSELYPFSFFSCLSWKKQNKV